MTDIKTESESKTGIELVKDERYALAARFHSVFLNFDPYKPKFANQTGTRFLLFPTDSYHLTAAQFGAFSAAIEPRRKHQFFISEIGWGRDSFEKGRHYLCNGPTFDEYTSLKIGVENAIYSTDGAWGFLLSDELHAIVACDDAFLKLFEAQYPLTKDLTKFLSYWNAIRQEGTDIDWLEPLCNKLSR